MLVFHPHRRAFYIFKPCQGKGTIPGLSVSRNSFQRGPRGVCVSWAGSGADFIPVCPQSPSQHSLAGSPAQRHPARLASGCRESPGAEISPCPAALSSLPCCPLLLTQARGEARCHPWVPSPSPCPGSAAGCKRMVLVIPLVLCTSEGAEGGKFMAAFMRSLRLSAYARKITEAV